MAQFRKLVILPQELLDQGATATAPNHDNTVQTPGNFSSRLDAEMAEILNSNNFENDNEKYTMYQQALQRFLKLNSLKSASPLYSELTADNDAAESRISDEEAAIGDSHIIASVPKRYQDKAKKILHFLRINRNTFQWDRNGILSIDGEKLQRSHLIDLINDAVRYRKAKRSIGRSQFASALRRVGIPREYIGNDEFWHEGNLSINSENLNLSSSRSSETSRNNNKSTRKKTKRERRREIVNESLAASDADIITSSPQQNSSKIIKWSRLQ